MKRRVPRRQHLRQLSRQLTPRPCRMLDVNVLLMKKHRHRSVPKRGMLRAKMIIELRWKRVTVKEVMVTSKHSTLILKVRICLRRTITRKMNSSKSIASVAKPTISLKTLNS